MTDYVHGYGTREQDRLVEQAEHWRHRLISDDTTLEPGTRLLEVGCGVGAVLAVLGQEFPGVRLHGVDIAPKQLDHARGHLERAGVEATLAEADATALPFGDESFQHVWMMWFLEHVPDPPAVLREARRVLVPDGTITAIEVDYSTCRAEPSTPAFEALIRAMVQGMAAAGWSDAGTRLPGWLRQAGFHDIDPGERPFWWQGGDLASIVGMRPSSPDIDTAFSARGVVLVEGISDKLALEALARRLGRDLDAEGVSVLPIGGAQAIGKVLARLGPGGLGVKLAGLCDAAEERHFQRALERAGFGSNLGRADLEALGFYVCDADLEDELVRSLGAAVVERIIEAEGEWASFQTFQKQPEKRRLTREAQLHGFMWNRKIRYARLLVHALDLAQVPRPLDRVLAHV